MYQKLQKNFKKILNTIGTAPIVINNVNVKDIVLVYLYQQKYLNISRRFSLKRDVNRMLIALIFTFPKFLCNKKRYFIFSTYNNFTEFNNKKGNRIFNTLTNILNSDYLYFFNNYSYSLQQCNKLNETWCSYNFFFLIRRKIINRFIRITWSQDTQEIQDIFRENECGLPIKRIMQHFFSTCIVLKVYFKFKRPKAIFIDGYNHYKEVIYVCKLLKIPTIEFQHGLLTKNLTYDNLHTRNPLENKNFVPDYLFYYILPKDITNDNFYIHPDKCINIGHCYFEYLFDNYNKFRNCKKYKNYLLVTLQVGYCGKKIISFIIDVAKRMPEFHFVLLPRNRESVEHFILPTNVSFELQYNFYELLLGCSIHITWFSTSALEAYAIGRPNIFINLEGLSTTMFSDYDFDKNLVSYVEDADEFIKEVHRLNSTKKEVVMNQGQAPFIAFNHSKRLKNALADVGVV